MKCPKVTVLMTVYNGAKFLRNAIRSVINQTFNNFEFIIINDASTDKSLRVINSFTDPRIRVISNVKNIGLTKSLNIGLSLARGKYIARMDADDLSLSDRLTLQYRYLEAHPDISLLGGGAHFIDESNNVTRTKLRLEDHDSIFFYCFFNNPFIHSSVMFRKECLDTVGAYDDRFRYAQDYDLWSRWVDHFKVANLRDVIVKWRNTSSGITNAKRSEQAACANRISVDFYRNHIPGIESVDDGILLAIRDSRCASLSKSDVLKANFVINKMVHKYCYIASARDFGVKSLTSLEYSSYRPVNTESNEEVKNEIKDFTLSVVICTYSNVDLLKDMLPKVLDSKFVKQVIVIDNKSVDSTPEYLKSIVDERLKVITNEANKGVIKSRNQGLAVATSKYTMVLDDDQTPSSNTFSAYKDALGSFDIVGYEGHLMDFKSGLTVMGNVYNFTYVGAGGMCMRTEYWKKLGLFDEVFSPCFFEDPDLCIKARATGMTIGIVRRSGIEHKAHSTLNKYRPDLVYNVGDICVRNRRIFLSKYGLRKPKVNTTPMYQNITKVVQVLRQSNGENIMVSPGHIISGESVSYVKDIPQFKLVTDLII